MFRTPFLALFCTAIFCFVGSAASIAQDEKPTASKAAAEKKSPDNEKASDKKKPRIFTEPVVSRVELQLKVDGETVDVIERGDLLTVMKEEGENFLIMTHNGRRGIVSQVNVARLAEAVEVYDELIKEFPDQPRFHTLRASAWWARGDEIAALGDFDFAIEKGYRKADAFSSRGMFHASIGNFKEALEDYTEAIRQEPKQEQHFISRAAVYMNTQEYAKAIEDYSAAIEVNPKRATYFQQRAVAWKLAGDAKKSIADFTNALNVDVNHLPSLMGRGFIRYQSADHKGAVEDFSAVISLSPRSADAWNNRGYNRQILGDYERAISDYEQAVSLAPNYPLALTNHAWLLSTCNEDALRNGKKAVKSANKACELTNFEDANGLKALAAAYAETEQWEKAIGWQEKAVELATESQKEAEQKLLEQYRDNKPFRLVDVK